MTPVGSWVKAKADCATSAIFYVRLCDMRFGSWLTALNGQSIVPCFDVPADTWNWNFMLALTPVLVIDKEKSRSSWICSSFFNHTIKLYVQASRVVYHVEISTFLTCVFLFLLQSVAVLLAHCWMAHNVTLPVHRTRALHQLSTNQNEKLSVKHQQTFTINT